MTTNERAIVATLAGIVWDDNPVSAGRTQYTVYGVRFIKGKETHEKLLETYSYSEARKCRMEAYHHEMPYIEETKLCLLSDREHMTYFDRCKFVDSVIRENN